MSIARRPRREHPSPHPRWATLVLDRPSGLTTPFEDWCELTGIDPDALGAWEAFAAAG